NTCDIVVGWPPKRWPITPRRSGDDDHQHGRHGRAQGNVWLYRASLEADDDVRIIAGCLRAEQHEDGARWLVHQFGLRFELRSRTTAASAEQLSDRWMSRCVSLQTYRHNQSWLSAH